MKLLHPLVDDAGKLYGYAFMCPGCKRSHSYQVPRWGFNGDQARPTFTPSLRVFTPKTKDPVTGEEIPEETLCHLFLTDGQLRFCGDSTCPEWTGWPR